MEKKKVKVTIAGATYSLLTDETAAYTNELATDIDEKIKEIQSANPFITANQAAILVAIELADQVKKTEQIVESYRSQIKDYLKDTSEAQTERDFYKRELDRMRTEAKAKKTDQIILFTQSHDEA